MSSFCIDMNNTYLFGKPINGVSSLTFPSRGFSIRPVIVPDFTFSPKKKRMFSRTAVLIRAHSSSPVVGFEVDFKPSFDDYLKVMESVKTVREKRSKTRGDSNEHINGERSREAQEDKANKRGSIQNVVRDEKKVVYGENVRWVKDKGSMAEGGKGDGRGSIHNPTRDEQNYGYGKNMRWVKDKSKIAEEDEGDKRGSIRNPTRDENNYGYGKNVRWVKDKSNIAEEDEGDIRGSSRNSVRDERKFVYGENVRWVKDKSNIAEEDEGNSRGFIRNSVRGERNFVYGENERWIKDKGYLSEEDSGDYQIGDEPSKANEAKFGYSKSGRWVKDKGNVGVEDKFNAVSSRNWIRDEPKVNESNFGVKYTERFNTHGRNVRWEESQGKSTFVKEKDYGFKVDEVRIRGREIMSGRNVRWEGNQGKRDSTKEKDRSFRLDNDRIRGREMALGNKKLSGDNIVFRRRNRDVSEESDGDEEFGFERAAFKSMGGLDDIVDKPQISRNEMEERIQKLARCLNGADVNMPEWMFSKMIRSARIRFSDHSILRIIQLLGKLGNWRRVLQLIDWLQSRERFNSHKLRFIYTTALSVLGKARRPVEALNLFKTMQQQMSTYPDLVAYHSMAVTLGQAGHMRELFEVIDIMKSPPKKKFKNGVLEKWDPRLEPDIVVYNAVLNACVRRKQWEGAFWVMQQLQGKGQQPSGTTYGLVMEVMLACGKYNLVHDFYKKVLKSSIPNALTYKVLVNTLWREGKADDAVLAVEDMERRGVVGSAALYYDLARCLCCAGRCQEALVQVEKICRVANKPLVVTYTGLMQACLDAGNIENGAYVFNHMHKFCSPNLVTCNIILKAYIDHGKFEEAKCLFHKLLEDGKHVSSKADYKERVIPDTYSFNTMLDACVEEKRWDEFEVFYKGMLEYGYPFNAKRHLRMILDAGRAGKGELLETTWNHLKRNSQILPPHPLLKEMFCMKLELGDCAAALSYISSHHPSNLQVFSHNAWLNFFNENTHRLQKDSILRLVHEVSLLMAESDAQNLILQNLVLACKEFLKTRLSVPQTECVETQIVLC